MLANHSLNWLLFEPLGSTLFQKSLECYIIASGYALGDYVTFLRFLKQRRPLDILIATLTCFYI